MRITELIEPSINMLGLELIRVSMRGPNHNILQIMVDSPGVGGKITVEECAALSRTISALMDVEEPVLEAYHLEVSSPGIDRPLTRVKDFDLWRGFEVKIELVRLVSGRRRFSGKLDGIEDNSVILIIDGERELLPLADIAKSKLVLTDELIAHVTGIGRSENNAE